jgi:hypothetical protein
MVERNERDNVCIQQTIYKLVIEIKPFLINLAASGRKDARPRNGKAIGFQADLLHQADIFFPKTIVIVCNITGVVVPDLSRCMGKAIPG